MTVVDILTDDLFRMTPNRSFSDAGEICRRRDYSTLVELLEGCNQLPNFG